MEMHAYDDVYLESSQNIMGHMFDYAVNELGMNLDDFADRFIISGIAKEMERGNPSFSAGRTGPEIAKLVVNSSVPDMDSSYEIMYVDRSSEYWCGWTAAYYQWLRAFPYSYIFRAVSASNIREMYGIFHEMDITKSVNEIDLRIREYYQDTNLKRFRKNLGISQKELSLRSGVPIRQIQLFEQRQRDIGKASATTVLALSHALYCDVKDLILFKTAEELET